MDNVIQVLQSSHHKTTEEIIADQVSSVFKFSEACPQSDDITLLAFKFTSTLNYKG